MPFTSAHAVVSVGNYLNPSFVPFLQAIKLVSSVENSFDCMNGIHLIGTKCMHESWGYRGEDFDLWELDIKDFFPSMDQDAMISAVQELHDLIAATRRL